jgi:hypothetical protein
MPQFGQGIFVVRLRPTVIFSARRSRKAIPDETQKNVLTKSRRRCCLCFWLEGKDEVQKGQIAHLDGDNENNAEDNLAFLCFVHHDDYDGTTRLAKGLRMDEVKHWRDELYREIAYRFRGDVEDRKAKEQFAYLEQTMPDFLDALHQDLKQNPLARTVLTVVSNDRSNEGGLLVYGVGSVPGLMGKLEVLQNHGLMTHDQVGYRISEQLAAYLRKS